MKIKSKPGQWLYSVQRKAGYTVPTQAQAFYGPEGLIMSSKCYNRDRYQLHDVLILEAKDEDAFWTYRIQQANNNQHPLQRDNIGSIQVRKSSGETWLRWDLGAGSTRMLSHDELANLLDILEYAPKPLSPDLALKLSTKNKLKHCYKS